MTLSRHARWSAAVALLAGAPGAAQTAKPPDIPPAGAVWTYAATMRLAVSGKPATDLEYRHARRVTEAGPDWFKVDYETPFQDKKIHMVEKRSADPFSPPLTSESVLLTAQGEPVFAGASLKLIERSDGGVTGSLFPLDLGKVAQYPFFGVGSAGEVPGVRECKVESREQFAAPMGTY